MAPTRKQVKACENSLRADKAKQCVYEAQ